MRRQAGTNAAFAAALCGMLPTLLESNKAFFSLTLISILILLFSALVIIFYKESTSRVWKWIFERACSIEIEFAAAGLGLASTGLSLIIPLSPWAWLGFPMFILGGLFIGAQIGKGISIIIRNLRK